MQFYLQSCMHFYTLPFPLTYGMLTCMTVIANNSMEIKIATAITDFVKITTNKKGSIPWITTLTSIANSVASNISALPRKNAFANLKTISDFSTSSYMNSPFNFNLNKEKLCKKASLSFYTLISYLLFSKIIHFSVYFLYLIVII